MSEAQNGGNVMERLTDKAWRNFDPWECCGQDKYCQRGCHDPGGCTKGCIVPQLYARLGAYEDTRLTPELVQKIAELAIWIHKNGLEKIKKWIEADRDGRLVVLPCKPDGSMLNTSDPERPEIMKRIHFAVAYVCGGIVFHQPYNIFIENVSAGYIRPLNEEAEKALEAKKDE